MKISKERMRWVEPMLCKNKAYADAWIKNEITGGYISIYRSHRNFFKRLSQKFSGSMGETNYRSYWWNENLKCI